VPDRDPESIKADIDAARERLAATVDTLAGRANPHRLADEAKVKMVAFVKQPAVSYSLAGLGAVVILLMVRRFRHR
jgi:hypothetical protein